MEEQRGLTLLGKIMGWDDTESTAEFAWLRMMARVKYDGYRDFLAGMRFLESLAAWLQQFKTQDERRSAYELLRRRLIYVSPSEMQRLVELFYPCFMERELVRTLAERRKIPGYQVWADEAASKEIRALRRRTLIMGLSDGARIDVLRHGTVGVLTNEQFVVQTQVDRQKWADLLGDLQEDQKDKTAAFEMIYLLDDFMGTGSSFLRYDEAKKKWKGKLCRFLQSLEDAGADGRKIVADGWTLGVHHYMATQRAVTDLKQKDASARAAGVKLPERTRHSYGAIVPSDVCVSTAKPGDRALYDLTQKYYSTKIQTRHTDVGGVTHLGLGYGGCALPVVLDHNTPNNSLAILWAEVAAGPDKNNVPQPEMRALFRRRQRHTEGVS